MKFAGHSIGAALAAALIASPVLAAPAENARGQEPPPLQAQPQAPRAAAAPPAAVPEAARRPAISMQSVIDIVRRRTPGQQANVVLEGVNYRVRWKAENGRLIDYVIDAQSGVIRSAQGE